jgi:hypothetical protein
LEKFEKLCVCVEKNVRDPCKSPKTFFLTFFGGRDFFQNLDYKKNFKILKNIFLDFSFSKKQ